LNPHLFNLLVFHLCVFDFFVCHIFVVCPIVYFFFALARHRGDSRTLAMCFTDGGGEGAGDDVCCVKCYNVLSSGGCCLLYVCRVHERHALPASGSSSSTFPPHQPTNQGIAATYSRSCQIGGLGVIFSGQNFGLRCLGECMTARERERCHSKREREVPQQGGK